LLLPVPGELLPTEAAFGFSLEGLRRVADVGRICVTPECRTAQHRLFLGLLSRTWLEARSHGLTGMIGTFTAAMARLYRRLGLGLVHLGAARQYWGEERMPCLVRPAEAVPHLLRWVPAED
jgi:hypothetical protein